ENVVLTVQTLQAADPILSDAVNQKKLKVVGGVYDLNTGKVELVNT
ncbi:MAG: carbonic anhydrase, partial [Verrucomicrobia bacterium]|nr:carbonic anhydrase [Verrucomicrobiota bacterium]